MSGISTKIDLDQISKHLETCISNEFLESVKLDEYVFAYRNINSFFNQLGSIFTFVKDDVESKCSILEKHFRGPNGLHYETVLSMVRFEISHGLISAKDIKLEEAFSETILGTLETDSTRINSELNGCQNCDGEPNDCDRKPQDPQYNALPSGSRSLLRLHRAMAFIVQLFPALLKSDTNQTSIIRGNIIKLYGETLAKFHPWIVRKAVQLALWAACPSREKLMSLVHYDESIDDLKEKCEHLSGSGGKVMDKVQKIYETYGILDLP